MGNKTSIVVLYHEAKPEVALQTTDTPQHIRNLTACTIYAMKTGLIR